MNIEDELFFLVSSLMKFPRSEEEDYQITSRISQISPDPAWVEHVFHSPQYMINDQTLDVNAVVSKIMSYKPIQLPDRSNEKIE
ncbi:hypothetical protein KZ813_03140 [Sphingomonas sp. RHCKR7]|uniref:hypothetical protein n=1 Tax=Sphingomonas folli TaxID=2862497 RepID=UPI001CA5B7F7|nr:hypothetical protein [Sphingomonas folli]MBW6525826.1 hypothetical protein [Sphingomonas folli]